MRQARSHTVVAALTRVRSLSWSILSGSVRWSCHAALGIPAILVMLGCTARDDMRPAGEAGWLAGTPHEKFDVVAKHLRGFDVAMAETGYRYNALYFAGQDHNWEFADSQAQKIQLAMQLGFERRPKRAASAQSFLTTALPGVREAIAQRDPALFDQRFTAMTASCTACHAAERVGFVTVGPPATRLSPAGAPTAAAPSLRPRAGG